MLLCVWYYVKDRLNYIFSFLEGILIWKTTIALRHAPRSIHSILSLFYTFLHLYLSVVLFIYLFILTHTVHTISIEVELQCLMTCVASPGSSVPYKFSRHFFLCLKNFRGFFLTPTWRRWEVWRPCRGSRVGRRRGRTGNQCRSRRSRCEKSRKNRRKSWNRFC